MAQGTQDTHGANWTHGEGTQKHMEMARDITRGHKTHMELARHMDMEHRTHMEFARYMNRGHRTPRKTGN